MNFEKQFTEWVNNALAEELPAGIKGFCFNLFETEASFMIELIGAPKFNEKNADWACEELFVPYQRQLKIPRAYSGEKGEACLEKMKKLLLQYLSSNQPGVQVLKAAAGVAIGFVDGELIVLTKAY